MSNCTFCQEIMTLFSSIAPYLGIRKIQHEMQTTLYQGSHYLRTLVSCQARKILLNYYWFLGKIVQCGEKVTTQLVASAASQNYSVCCTTEVELIFLPLLTLFFYLRLSILFMIFMINTQNSFTEQHLCQRGIFGASV